MIVINPSLLTPNEILSTTANDVLAPNPPLWVPMSLYSKNDLVKRPNNRVYKYLLDYSVAESTTPEESAVLPNPKWLDYSYINEYKLLNYYSNDSTIFQSMVEYIIEPSDRVDALAFIGMENVETIQVEQYSSSMVLLNTYSIDNSTGAVVSGNEVFEERSTYYSRIITEIPPVYNAKYKVILTTVLGEEASITYLVLGASEDIGPLQNGVNVSAENFSLITKDEFGKSTLTPRRNIPKISGNTLVPSSKASRMLSLRKTINAKPVVWCGVSNPSDKYYDSLLILGVYKTFKLEVNNPMYLTLNFSIEEI